MSRFFSIVLFLAITRIVFAQNPVDSLQQLLEFSDNSGKMHIYNEIAEKFVQTDSAKVFENARKAIDLAVKNNSEKEKGKAFFLMGEACYYAGSYNRAIHFYKKAQNCNLVAGDLSLQIEIVNSIGLSHFYLQQFEQSVQYYFEGLRLAEKANDQEQTAYLYSNIAMVYTKMTDYQMAAEYYRKALKINLELKHTESIGVNLNGIGVSFFRMEKPDSAKVYYIRALKVFQESGNRERVAILLNNIANIYGSQKDSIRKALSYYHEAEKVFNNLGDKQNVVHVVEGLGSVYREMKLYNEAISTYQRGIKLAEKAKPDYQLLQLYYSDLAKTYEAQGNYKKALQYERIQRQYSDSLLNKDRIKQIATLEKQYETEKKEAEIGRLKAEQELSKARRKQDQYFKMLGFVSAFFLLIALFYMSYRFYEKKRNNEILAEKNRQIRKSEEDLRVLNAAKNKFFSIIAHDLKSPFHTVMGYSQLLSKEYHLYSDEEREKFAQNIFKSANTIFKLLSNLLEWSRAQTNRLTFNPIDIEFVLIYDNVVNLLKSNADRKKVSIRADFDESREVFADPIMLETVVRNLISNAIKYTGEEGEVVVSFSQTDREYMISVKDNGIGISPENLEKLFQIDSKVKQKGTQNEDGSGIGLILCKELIDKHRGRIWVESTPNMGSSFYVTLPLPEPAESSLQDRELNS